MHVPDQLDAVVVGAGVIGLAVGCDLARRGLRTAVVEKDHPGAGASPVAGGMLAPISEAKDERPEVVTFGRQCLKRYPGWVKELEQATGIDCDYRTEGTLLVALTRDDWAELAHDEAMLQRQGLSAVRLDAEQLLKLEPFLSPRVVGALHCPEDHCVDPRRLVEALALRLQQLGGTLLAPLTIDRVELRGGRCVGVSGTAGRGEQVTIEARETVLAAGSWTTRSIRSPLADHGVRPVRGQLVLLKGREVLKRVVRHPEVYLIPRAGGELALGATAEEKGFETIATAGGTHHLLRWAMNLIPGLDEHELIGTPVGLRPAARDHLPMIGPAGAEHLWAAAAHYRNGILLAPGTAELLGAWIVAGERSAALAPFDPLRVMGAA